MKHSILKQNKSGICSLHRRRLNSCLKQWLLPSRWTAKMSRLNSSIKYSRVGLWNSLLTIWTKVSSKLWIFSTASPSLRLSSSLTTSRQNTDKTLLTTSTQSYPRSIISAMNKLNIQFYNWSRVSPKASRLNKTLTFSWEPSLQLSSVAVEKLNLFLTWSVKYKTNYRILSLSLDKLSRVKFSRSLLSTYAMLNRTKGQK